MSEAQDLIRVEHASKKFCRSLGRSLRYGVFDLAAEFSGRDGRERHLRKGEFWAVKDVSFALRGGDFLGLIGHNGAGKTTLLKMLTGLIKPDGGRIESRGRVAALIALGAGFNPLLSGRDNIAVNAALLGMSRREVNARMESIIDFSGIRKFIDAPVQGYSSGMVVRLGFAVASATNPDVLILDEVLAVGDMEFRAKCHARLAEVQRAGGALVLVSHSMEQIAHHCNRAILLHEGRIACQGPPEVVIGEYFSLMGGGTRNAGHGPGAEVSKFEEASFYNPGERRWGDGRASIVDVRLEQDGCPWPKVLVPGVPASLTLDVLFHDYIEHPIYGMTIKGEDGAQVLNTNSRMLLAGEIPPGTKGRPVQVTFEFRPSLVPGAYSISLGVASETPEGVVPHDRRYDCIRARLANPVTQAGEPELDVRIRVSSIQ